jgi:penicillin-binding protein 2B
MEKVVKFRTLVIGVFFTLFFVALIFKIYQVQVVDAAWLLEKAERSWGTDKVLRPKRGTILDRNNKILAEDAPSYTVAVNPQIINNREIEKEVVEGLAPILGMSYADKKNKLHSLVTKQKEDGTFLKHVEIRNEGWKIDSGIADQIKKLKQEKNWQGIYLLEEQKRYYPINELAAHLLGYNNKEGEPKLGLELEYNDKLQGSPGLISFKKDLLGYELPQTKATYRPPINGKSIRLTIDQNIQHYMEQAMEKVFLKYKPKSMTAIAVDPMTMEVLGLANLPNFNPNEYWEFADYSDFTNHAVRSQYEPGSTFKIVTLAGAVEEGLFHPSETYLSGKIKVPGSTIHDHNWGKGWGEITYLEGLKRSSNVAFVKLGYEGLGEDKLRDYITKFGFGQKTNVDLPGEMAGIIDFRYPSEIATATFGQGKVTVTAMQQVAAVAAIANGGKLMQPFIVKEIIDPETNKVLRRVSPKVIRQVVSEQTANQVSEYLEQVVSDREIGTGRKAYIEGYRVAGKTGTGQKVVDGKYSEDKWVVSFIGYAPAENPKILVCVIVDEPDLQGDYRGGGDVAAPIFKEIVAQSLRYLGVPSNQMSNLVIAETDPKEAVPDVSNLTLTEAKNELVKRNFEYDIMGNGQKVLKQFPEKGTEIGAGQRIYLLTEAEEHIQMPNLTGKSLRDALETCSLLKVACTVEGEGYVSSQTFTGSAEKKVLALKLEPVSRKAEHEEETKDITVISEAASLQLEKTP